MEQIFYRFNGRLAMFQASSASKDHWEERWSKTDIGALLRSYSRGKLDEFDGVFTRYLPRDLPILEAGCGKGQLVMALSARGYRVEGVDYAAATIERIRAAAPALNVRTGDIYRLDVPDQSYGGYISIGLFEHNAAGPEQALRETYRVLHPKGVALISVPFLNRSRARVLKRAPVASKVESPEGMSFYQYYFALQEFQEHIENVGLRVLECYPYGVYTGLVRDSPFWRWLEKRGFFVWPLHHGFIRRCERAPSWVRFRAAHMVMFVCRRAEG